MKANIALIVIILAIIAGAQQMGSGLPGISVVTAPITSLAFTAITTGASTGTLSLGIGGTLAPGSGLLTANVHQAFGQCTSVTGACGAAYGGAFTIAASAASRAVATSLVLTSSEVLVQFNSSLSTRLGVTCNTTAPASIDISAITASTSFTVTVPAVFVTNPGCFSFFIVD